MNMRSLRVSPKMKIIRIVHDNDKGTIAKNLNKESSQKYATIKGRMKDRTETIIHGLKTSNRNLRKGKLVTRSIALNFTILTKVQ